MNTNLYIYAVDVNVMYISCKLSLESFNDGFQTLMLDWEFFTFFFELSFPASFNITTLLQV